VAHRLEGKVSVITGAGQGIGKTIASRFAEEGSKIILIDISEKVFETEAELKRKGFQAIALKADVTSFDEVKRAAKRAEGFGKPDVLVNNAGVVLPFNLERYSESDLDKVLAVNLKGSLNCSVAFAPYMIEKRYGRIINISSIAGIEIGTKSIYYSASKAGVIGLTRSLALWLAEYSITVNAICPGIVRTALTEKSLGEKVLADLSKKIPLKRLASTMDIANLALFLASEESGYLTGQYIIIDGGLTIKSDVW